MAGENEVQYNLVTKGETAGADAVAASMDKVADAQQKVAQSAKSTAADGKALEANMRGLAETFKASQQQYRLDADAKKNATAQTVQFGQAQGKAAQLTDEATRALHSAKESQAAVKDLTQGLGQILEGNLSAGFINVTKAAKGFTALDIAGRLGLVGAAVSAAITLWQAYQAVLEATKKGEEEAARAISEGTTKALASRVEGLKQANAEMAKSIEHSKTIAELESQAKTAESQGALAEINRREDDGEIDAFDAERQRAQITFDEESQRIGTQMSNTSEQIKTQREIVEQSKKAVGEAESTFASTAGNADLHAAADKFLQDSKEVLKTEQQKLQVLEKEQEVLQKKSATAKQQRDATLAEIKREEGQALENNMRDVSKRGAEDARKEAETRRQIRERIDQSDADAKIDDAEMEDRLREQRIKEAEQAEKAEADRLKDQGFDPTTGRRGRRTRPGAPNVSPQVGNTDFNEALKPRLNKGDGSSTDKAASSAQQTGQEVKKLADATTAMKDEAVPALNEATAAMNAIANQLRTFGSQARMARTQATTNTTA